jgi:AhpC/TSA family
MPSALRERTPAKSGERRRTIAVISAVLAALTAGLVLGLRTWSQATPAPASAGGFSPLPVGAKAPRMGLSKAGSAPASTSFPAAGALTLVSFLATQPDTAATASRSQAVELASLADQYGPQGVHVLIVDDTAIPASLSMLENTAYDWQLSDVPLLADPGHVASDRFGVASSPTTLLIGRTGTVIDRWNGYVPTAVAAQALASAISPGKPT